MYMKTKARLAAGIWILGLGCLSNPVLGVGYNDNGSPRTTPEYSHLLARQNFDVFLKYAFSNPSYASAAAVKVRASATEAPYWVTPYMVDDTYLIGISAGRPPVRIQHENIQDWSLLGPDGRLYGNFDARQAVSNAAPDLAKAGAISLSHDPLPAF